MKKLSFILMVGLAFTVLQVSTVVAQTGAPDGPMCDSNPACVENCCGQCDPNPACVENCCPDGTNDHQSGGPNDHQPGMTGGPNDHRGPGGPNDHQSGGPNDHQPGMTGGPNDHRGPGCDPNLAPDAGGCPDGFQGKPGGPPHHEGEHHDGPPIDPRSGQPFAKADEAKFQKYADECEATRGLLSEGSTQELVAEGFTRIQVEKLCKDGPDHHDGPPGGPDGHHDGPPGMPPQ